MTTNVRRFLGAEWIKRQHYGNNMSPLGEEVADLLGDVFAGIYHLNHTSLRKVDWSDPYCITYIHGHGVLSTFDSDQLTRLVVLSHDRMIRVSVAPRAFQYLELMFHKRMSRDGDIYYRMPTMEAHLELIRIGYR